MRITTLRTCDTMQQPCDISLYAAFFMEGIRDKNYDDVLQSWDQGCIELVSEVIAYAPRLKRLVEAAVRARDDSVSFPGVFEYEVCNSFGAWIAEKILEHGDMPAASECMEWLAKAVIEFFSQCEDAEHIAAINAAVESAKSFT